MGMALCSGEVLGMMSLPLMNHGQGQDPSGACRHSLPCLAPELPVYPAQPCLESRRCSAQGVWGPASTEALNSDFMPSSLQHRCTWRSRYHLCGPIPLQLWAVFFSFHAAPAQWWGRLCVKLHSLKKSASPRFLPLPAPTISHFILCRAG